MYQLGVCTYLYNSRLLVSTFFLPYLYFLIFVVVVFHTVNMVSGTNHLYNVGFTYFFNLEINDKLEAN